MIDALSVRVARAADAPAIERFMRTRLTWLEDRTVFVAWEKVVVRHATAVHGIVHGCPWHVFVATRNDIPVGRVCVCIEPPGASSGSECARLDGVLGLNGLCTNPHTPDVARHLLDWAARYAGMLGLHTVRLPASCARLRDHYEKEFGFVVTSESPLPQGKTLWELHRPAIDPVLSPM